MMHSAHPKIHLTQTPYTPQAWGGDGLMRRFRAHYEAGSHRPFALVDNPRDADLIVYCEDYQADEQRYAPRLRAERCVAEFPDRVFVITAEDQPLGFLSGVYVSLPRARFDAGRHRAGAYFGDINLQIARAEQERHEVTPQLLFSFVGARTSAVRAALFAQFAPSPHWQVRETGNTQFNINVEDPAKRSGQDSYLRTMLESHFVLCPRGYGTASFRLFETMRLGRVPVILADDWVEPSGPDWSTCAVRVSERNLARLPDLLNSRRADATTLGANARRTWESWFAPDVYAGRCLEWIHHLQQHRRHDEAAAFRRWPRLIAAARAQEAGGGRFRRLWRSIRSRLRNPSS